MEKALDVLNPNHVIGPGGAGLDERLQRAEHIVGAIDKGIAILNTDGVVRWANDSFRCWCPGDPVGQPFLAVLNFAEHTPSHEALSAARQGASACFRLTHDHLILDVTLTPNRSGNDVNELIAFCDDVTEAVKRQQKLNALYKAGQELETIDPDALTDMNFECRVGLLKQNIRRYIHDLLHYDVIEIRSFDPKTLRLLPLMEEGMLPEAAQRELFAKPEGNGVTGYVAATKTPYLCMDASNDPRFLQGSAGVKSSMTVPILFNDELIGTFNVESPRPNAFGEEDLQFTELFARELGRTLHTLNLLNQQERQTAQSVLDSIGRELAIPTDNLIAAASVLLDILGDRLDLMPHAQRVLNETRKIKAALVRVQGTVPNSEGTKPDPQLLGQRILVLDPDERIRKSAHHLLERQGCIVKTAATAKDAIAMAKVGKYHVIMMSVKLTDAGGTDTFFGLTKAAPDARLVLLRGFGHDGGHTEVNARSAGYNPTVLFKPFQEEYLIPTLATLATPV